MGRPVLGPLAGRVSSRSRKGTRQQGKGREMNRTITVAPVRKSIKVAAAPDRAFHVFTAGMSRWWLKSDSINKSTIKDIVIEPKAGGRWFERGEDGSECEWGKVLAWEPPTGDGSGGRLLLAWQINADFRFDPALST